MLPNMTTYRFLKNNELKVIKYLLSFVKLPYKINTPIKKILVTDLNDGGMGSFEFFGKTKSKRTFGMPLIEADTYDIDGRKVMLQLSVDNEGYLYQLDSWTSDFNPLVGDLGAVFIFENINVRE
ncbi:DUF6984 family protein [Moraxella marmotae]|uniref:DUF6984 family protein n=1 Tax=Moraxella marmotae TaxID=3344520 RepID=UPI0035F29906